MLQDLRRHVREGFHLRESFRTSHEDRGPRLNDPAKLDCAESLRPSYIAGQRWLHNGRCTPDIGEEHVHLEINMTSENAQEETPKSAAVPQLDERMSARE